MKNWRPVDGDAFLTHENFLFYTFGYEHPTSHVLAFLKYIPSRYSSLFPTEYLPTRWKLGSTQLARPKELYSASNLQKIIQTLRTNFPQYLYFSPAHGREIISSPLSLVKKTYVPSSCLQKLFKMKKRDRLQALALELTELLSSESGVSREDFGLHGSIALNMHKAGSDIDLVVYGSKNFRRVEETIGCMVRERELSYLFNDILDKLRKQRCLYKRKTFVYNAVRKQEEVTDRYGDHRYSPIKPITFACRISDDTQAMFRPAIYPVSDYQALNSTSRLERNEIPTLVVSMIGCHRNVAREGDEVQVSGVLERVESTKTGEVHYQAVVGSGTREDERIWLLARN